MGERSAAVADGAAHVTADPRDPERLLLHLHAPPPPRAPPPLPHPREYTQQAYWAARFAVEESHEWLSTWPQLRQLLLPFLGPPAASRICILGNGNSALPVSLAREGFTRVTSTDYEPAVVAAMRARHAGDGVTWAVADMLELTASGLPLASFDVVLDKGGTWKPTSVTSLTTLLMRR